MTTLPPTGRHIFDEPATYQIQIEGKLDAAWSVRLEGMEIRTCRTEDGQFVTTLEGRLIDQAALSGVLLSLYELQFAVLAVKRL
jgi:hypothetical protein